jgi:hypothetical protein
MALMRTSVAEMSRLSRARGMTFLHSDAEFRATQRAQNSVSSNTSRSQHFFSAALAHRQGTNKGIRDQKKSMNVGQVNAHGVNTSKANTEYRFESN